MNLLGFEGGADIELKVEGKHQSFRSPVSNHIWVAPQTNEFFLYEALIPLKPDISHPYIYILSNMTHIYNGKGTHIYTFGILLHYFGKIYCFMFINIKITPESLCFLLNVGVLCFSLFNLLCLFFVHIFD